MSNHCAVAFFIFFGYLIQTTVLPKNFFFIADKGDLPFFQGHTIDVVLLCLFYLSFHRKIAATLIWTTVIIFLANVFGLAWQGAMLTSYFLTAILGSLGRQHLFLASGRTIMGVAWVFGMFQGICHIVAGHFWHRIPGWFHGQWGFVLCQATLNALIAPLIVYALWMVDLWTMSPIQRRKQFPEPDKFGTASSHF